MKKINFKKYIIINCKVVSLLILLLLQMNFFYSQNYRIYYEFKYNLDTIGTPSSEIMVLDIRDNENIFLNKKFIDIDSINKKQTNERLYVTPKYNTIIKFSKDNYVFKTFKKIDINYFSFPSEKKLSWKIEKNTKKIANIVVQEATLFYGGRNWVAWFSKEIALPYGPHYFYGLPGLIIEIYDDNKNFNFSMMKMESNKNKINISNLIDQETIEIKENEFPKLLLSYYNNPLFNNKTIGWKMFHKTGEEFSPKDYKELEIYIKNDIKKYNNPIELDTKIDYK